MRRRVMLMVAAFAVVVVAAAPAAAQRDPFDPLVTEGAASAGTGVTISDTSAPTEPVAVVEVPEGLANTGMDTASFLAIAYVLIAAGGAAVILSRTAGRPRATEHAS